LPDSGVVLPEFVDHVDQAKEPVFSDIEYADDSGMKRRELAEASGSRTI
jgi:hypothetical protein